MITFKVTSENVKKWFPETHQEFVNDLRNSKSSSSETLEDNISWVVTWGFFVKKANNEEEKIEQMYNYRSKMDLVYNGRVNLEIPKIRCSLNMKAGYYYRMDRVLEKETPDFIKDMALEIIKYVIFMEQSQIGNPDVIESIKEFCDMMTSPMEVDLDNSDPDNIDDILDKINGGGMGCLSPKDLKFLDSMSKNKN